MSRPVNALPKEPGYAKAYDYLLDSDMTGEELRLYLIIMRYGDSSGCRIPLQKTLCKRRKISKQGVSNLINKLVEKKWLYVERIPIPKNKRSNVFATKRNRYTLTTPPGILTDGGVYTIEDVPENENEVLDIPPADEHEPEPFKPDIKSKIRPADDLDGYTLQIGLLKGQNINELKNNPDSLDWYANTSRVDGPTVRAWIENQKRTDEELDRIVTIILSPHRSTSRDLRAQRCRRDLLEYTDRQKLSRQDVLYIQSKLEPHMKE